MLTLRVKKTERVYLQTSDGEVEILIHEIRGDHTKVCFNAPEEIIIERESVRKRRLENEKGRIL